MKEEPQVQQVQTHKLEPVVSESVPVRESGPAVIRLAGPMSDILASLDEFQKIRNGALKNHIKEINGKPFVTRSGWRIVALAFGISDEIVEKITKEDENGDVIYAEYEVRAFVGNRSVIGVGACTATEGNRTGNRKRSPHDVKATAHTRAKSRAISDLVGQGELSAEEMTSLEAETNSKSSEPAPENPDNPALCQCSNRILAKDGHSCSSCKKEHSAGMITYLKKQGQIEK